jgi:hypothetical protein
MTISIVGYILILILLSALLISKFDYILQFLILISGLFSSLGFFIMIDEILIDYNRLLLLIFFVHKSPYIFQKKITLLAKTNILMMSLSLLVILYFQLFQPNVFVLNYFDSFQILEYENIISKLKITSNNYISLLTLFLYLFYISNLNLKYHFYSLEFIKKAFYIFFLIIIIEFILINLLDLNIRFYINLLFGLRDSQVTENLYRYGFKSAYFSFAEPSILSFSMIIYYNIIMKSKVFKTKFINFILGFLISILSGSTTVIVVSLAFIPLLYLNFKKTKKSINYAVYSILIVILTLFLINDVIVYNIQRSINLILVSSTISDAFRINSITIAFQSFIQSPLFGVGFGSTYATALIPTMLANFGVVLFSIYIFIHYKIISRHVKIEITRSITLVSFVLLVFTGQFYIIFNSIMFIFIMSLYRNREFVNF